MRQNVRKALKQRQEMQALIFSDACFAHDHVTCFLWKKNGQIIVVLRRQCCTSHWVTRIQDCRTSGCPYFVNLMSEPLILLPVLQGNQREQEALFPWVFPWLAAGAERTQDLKVERSCVLVGGRNKVERLTTNSWFSRQLTSVAAKLVFCFDNTMRQTFSFCFLPQWVGVHHIKSFAFAPHNFWIGLSEMFRLPWSKLLGWLGWSPTCDASRPDDHILISILSIGFDILRLVFCLLSDNFFFEKNG